MFQRQRQIHSASHWCNAPTKGKCLPLVQRTKSTSARLSLPPENPAKCVLNNTSSITYLTSPDQHSRSCTSLVHTFHMHITRAHPQPTPLNHPRFGSPIASSCVDQQPKSTSHMDNCGLQSSVASSCMNHPTHAWITAVHNHQWPHHVWIT
jgi:hypothetical protein